MANQGRVTVEDDASLSTARTNDWSMDLEDASGGIKYILRIEENFKPLKQPPQYPAPFAPLVLVTTLTYQLTLLTPRLQSSP